MKKAAGELGGRGGGHAVACGAQVDEDKVQELIEGFEDELLREK